LDLEAGAALIDRALKLNSKLAEARHFGGWVKIWLGEPEAAIERFARAIVTFRRSHLRQKRTFEPCRPLTRNGPGIARRLNPKSQPKYPYP
jgi:hypothetical protein